MSVTVVVSVSGVASPGDVGGHFWVFMQYVRGLMDIGVDVWWLERLPARTDQEEAVDVARFLQLMNRFGLRGKTILYVERAPGEVAFANIAEEEALRTLCGADLLLNFDYRIPVGLLARFARSALVDIDPGLLQFWVSRGQLTLAQHDVYFTTGETVGTAGARFPDLGLPWNHIRPPVSLDQWPLTFDADAGRFTTVTSWWGDEWITDGTTHYENNKRVTFMDHVELPRRTSQPLEIAAYLGPGDAEDLRALLDRGWSVRHSSDVASTPEQYRSYIQSARGEFSCVKPSCIRFQNGWVSDRTLCYLASGKPAVVQYTGPNQYLPEGEGLFRFRTIEEAVDAIETINADYERHCKGARAIAEAFYAATAVARTILDHA